MTICERLFLTMHEQGLTGYKLSKILGVDSGIISGWKRRGTDPPAKYLMQISEFLGVSVEYLLTGKGADARQEEERFFSEQEIRLIEKYRILDEDGRDMVRGTLLSEQRRVLAEQSKKQDAI